MKSIETHNIIFLSHNILASAGVENDDSVHTRITHHVNGKMNMVHVKIMQKYSYFFHKTVTVLIW